MWVEVEMVEVEAIEVETVEVEGFVVPVGEEDGIEVDIS